MDMCVVCVGLCVFHLFWGVHVVFCMRCNAPHACVGVCTVCTCAVAVGDICCYLNETRVNGRHDMVVSDYSYHSVHMPFLCSFVADLFINEKHFHSFNMHHLSRASESHLVTQFAS